MHPFDEATALQATAPGHYAGATHPAYANMVGLLAAPRQRSCSMRRCSTRTNWDSRLP